MHASDLLATGRPYYKIAQELSEVYGVSVRQAEQYITDARAFWRNTAGMMAREEKRDQLRLRMEKVYEKAIDSAQKTGDHRALGNAVRALHEMMVLDGLAEPHRVDVQSTNVNISLDGTATKPEAVLKRVLEMAEKYGNVIDVTPKKP